MGAVHCNVSIAFLGPLPSQTRTHWPSRSGERRTAEHSDKRGGRRVVRLAWTGIKPQKACRVRAPFSDWIRRKSPRVRVCALGRILTNRSQAWSLWSRARGSSVESQVPMAFEVEWCQSAPRWSGLQQHGSREKGMRQPRIRPGKSILTYAPSSTSFAL